MRLPLSAVGLAAAVLLSVSACSGEDNPEGISSTTSDIASPSPEDTDTSVPSVTPTTEESSSPSSPSAAPSSASGSSTGANDFTMKTKDGSLTVAGAADRCQNPSETTLVVTFAGDGSTVKVNVKNSNGGVVVSGSNGFEGRVTSIMVGDTGNVMISGKGSAADDSARPTSFTITGTCP